VALAAVTLGATVVPGLADWLVLDVAEDVRLLEAWRYLTWPFVEGPLPGSLLTILFAGLMLAWLGRQLTAAWGERVFLGRVLFLVAGSGLLAALLLAPLGLSQRIQGIWPLTNALLVCWGLLFPGARLSWFGVLEMRGLTVARLVGWGTLVWALLPVPGGPEPLGRLVIYLPNLACVLLAWLMVGEGPRRGWRRWTGRWRERKLRRARSRFEVIDPGPRPPGEWLN
jgi:hypothetical protein